MYHVKCPSELCDENYIGEKATSITERVKDHNGRDHKSHILKHTLETRHGQVIRSDFSIIFKSFTGNKRKWKIHENPIYRGDCLKRGLRQLAYLRGGLAKKKWVGFLREG